MLGEFSRYFPVLKVQEKEEDIIRRQLKVLVCLDRYARSGRITMKHFYAWLVILTSFAWLGEATDVGTYRKEKRQSGFEWQTPWSQSSLTLCYVAGNDKLTRTRNRVRSTNKKKVRQRC